MTKLLIDMLQSQYSV